MRRVVREERRDTSAKKKDSKPKPQQIPSLFNAEGNPFIGGYVCCGRPFFGFWMGPITLLCVVLFFVWAGRTFWMAGINMELRGARAEAACAGAMRYWDRLMLTNWSMASDEVAIQRIGTFLSAVFSNGPFDFAEPFNSEDGKIISHGAKRGYSLEYDSADLQGDAALLYVVLKRITGRADILFAQKRRPQIESYYTQEQVDNRGKYVLTGADMVYRYTLPVVGHPLHRYDWSFRLTCKMRAVGPDPETDRNAWACYEAMLSHHHAEANV